MGKEKYYSIPLEEQETVISFSRDCEQVDIWTNDRTVITKLDKLCKTNPSMYWCRNAGKAMGSGDVMDKKYTCADKSLISFKPKKRVCAPLTDEQKEERAKRLKAYQESNGMR